jgi:hypothetical protein
MFALLLSFELLAFKDEIGQGGGLFPGVGEIFWKLNRAKSQTEKWPLRGAITRAKNPCAKGAGVLITVALS